MTKQSIACTLFEGDYHWGVGALINSLHAKGFTGIVCVGYRGKLPPWVTDRAQPDAATGALRLNVGGAFDAWFIEVKTKRHLTNYKPEFMLEVWHRVPHQADYLFFFDADIFISARWSYFEEWADAGLALVADGNTPLPVNHPIRVAWRKHYEPHGFRFAKTNDYHFNGGFIGVSRARLWTLDAWIKIQTIMEGTVRLDLPILLPGAPDWQRDRTFKFFLTDQDAMNIVADLEGLDVSAMGDEGMGWKQPAVFMQHACGGYKPWRHKYLARAIKGEPPTGIDFLFWQQVSAPLPLADAAMLKRIRFSIALSRRLARLGRAFNIFRPL